MTWTEYDSDEISTQEQLLKRQDSDARDYFSRLSSNLERLRYFFAIFILSGIGQSLISFFVILSYFSDYSDSSRYGETGSRPGSLILALVSLIISVGQIWFFALCVEFIGIQLERIRRETINNAAFREISLKMSTDTLDKLKQRANKIVNTIKIGSHFRGNFNNIVGDDNNVSQTMSEAGQDELAKAIALLVAYCEESKNPAAIRLADQISSEVSKDEPNRGSIFESWTTLVSILPGVSAVVEIAKGIKALLA